MMPSKLIKLLQAAKTELEVRGLSNSNVYSAISSEIYYLEEEEGLPQNWREENYDRVAGGRFFFRKDKGI